jgi:hypothetical protein
MSVVQQLRAFLHLLSLCSRGAVRTLVDERGESMESFSLFLIALVGLVWLSSGMIVWATLRLYLSRRPELVEAERVGEAFALDEERREAA